MPPLAHVLHFKSPADPYSQTRKVPHMLDQIRSLISAALDEREVSQEAVEKVLSAIEEEGRSEMNAEETEKFDAARAELSAGRYVRRDGRKRHL